MLHGIENWTITARDARRVTAAQMKYMRRAEGYTGTDYKTNTEIATELNILQFWTKYWATEEIGYDVSTECLVTNYRE